MRSKSTPSQQLATHITKNASLQTYYTIRFFVDRPLVPDAYLAYGYFRWVDDMLDNPASDCPDKLAFVEHQKALLESCYRGDLNLSVDEHEQMLVDLVSHDLAPDSGLQVYLRNMMSLMEFDTRRCGSVITQAELTNYTLLLALAVTEALHFFIGHDRQAALRQGRYLAVSAAHLLHMLRDMHADLTIGYFNLPLELVGQKAVLPADLTSPPIRRWVQDRVELARQYFRLGHQVILADNCLRRRLACCAYLARFEWMIHTIEQDNYLLRSTYPERKSLPAALWMGWRLLLMLIPFPGIRSAFQPRQSHHLRMDDR